LRTDGGGLTDTCIASVEIAKTFNQELTTSVNLLRLETRLMQGSHSGSYQGQNVPFKYHSIGAKGDFGHRSSTPIVANDWQRMTSYLIVLHSELTGRCRLNRC